MGEITICPFVSVIEPIIDAQYKTIVYVGMRLCVINHYSRVANCAGVCGWFHRGGGGYNFSGTADLRHYPIPLQFIWKCFISFFGIVWCKSASSSAGRGCCWCWWRGGGGGGLPSREYLLLSLLLLKTT